MSRRVHNDFSGDKYFREVVPLHKATLTGDWEAARPLLRYDKSLVNARITEGGETALHLAAARGDVRFVDRLLELMDASHLEVQNQKGHTALSFAAALGHVGVAARLVEKNSYLQGVVSSDSIPPLHLAAAGGHREMVEYLLPSSHFLVWPKSKRIALLTALIESGFYDIARRILSVNPKLGVAANCDGETPLAQLARKPSAFPCSSGQGSITTTSFLKLNEHDTTPQSNAYSLLDDLWEIVTHRDEGDGEIRIKEASKLLFIAVESGNYEFLIDLIHRCPGCLYRVNDANQSIFHLAILHRDLQIFTLIYELGDVKDLFAKIIDKDGNNMLHLAAKLAPQNQLNDTWRVHVRMGRETMWYKEVEKIVEANYRTMKNFAGKTPYDIFLAEHKSLMKEEGKLLKQTANSCMVVAILITTVICTSIFTIPGGFNSSGAPVLLSKKMFLAFFIFQIVGTGVSFLSIMMFVSILTSLYFHSSCFLKWQPLLLVIGLVSLFVSVVVAMVILCFGVVIYRGGAVGIVLISILPVVFTSVPIAFLLLTFPVLVTIIQSIISSKWLFRSKNRLFSA